MTSRRIVLDANILVRAVLGTRVRELIEEYGQDAAFFAPELAFAEAARHLPTIAAKRSADHRRQAWCRPRAAAGVARSAACGRRRGPGGCH